MGKKRRPHQKDNKGEQEAAIQVQITRLKIRKAVLKTSFTWIKKHQLIHLLGADELPSRHEIRGLKAKLIDQQLAVIDILVKLSDQYELQEDLQNEGLVSEEIEAINKEFGDVVEQANGYISESKGDTLSIASNQSSKKSQLSRKESLAQEHIRRITKEVIQKQIKLINAQKELEKKITNQKELNWNKSLQIKEEY